MSGGVSRPCFAPRLDWRVPGGGQLLRGGREAVESSDRPARAVPQKVASAYWSQWPGRFCAHREVGSTTRQARPARCRAARRRASQLWASATRAIDASRPGVGVMPDLVRRPRFEYQPGPSRPLPASRESLVRGLSRLAGGGALVVGQAAVHSPDRRHPKSAHRPMTGTAAAGSGAGRDVTGTGGGQRPLQSVFPRPGTYGPRARARARGKAPVFDRARPRTGCWRLARLRRWQRVATPPLPSPADEALPPLEQAICDPVAELWPQPACRR